MDVKITELCCEFRTEALGIEAAHPLLSWKLASESHSAAQSAYRVCAASSEARLDAPDLWDSGRVESAENSAIYMGATPESNCKVYWRVCVWDEQGVQSAWSPASCWRQGIAASDWRGVWIGYDAGREDYDPSVPYYCADDFEAGENHPFLPKPALLRAEFQARTDVVSATLYMSALGLAEMYLNGEKASAGHMAPGLCDYRKRAYYFAYDVTRLVHGGANALCAVLADGWYAGYIGLNPRQWWGAKPRLNAELHIEYTDGSVQRFVTDEHWRASTGPWLYADIMHGAGYDATLEPDGWMKPGYAGSWQPVSTGAEYPHIPCAHPGVPIVEHARYAPAKTVRLSEDEILVDFGRCFAGVVCVRVRGPRGTRIDMYHAEELTRDGRALYLRGNRSAQAHDCYVLRGGGEERFQPEFTYHGFRYAHIQGLKNVELLSVEGVAISSALPNPTEIESGNRVVQDALWMIRNTQQSNQYDQPTDVCARDERLGWGAEGHFFMHTAVALNDNALFLRKWLQDILDGQGEDGCFWATAPAVMMKDILPFAGDLQSNMGVDCAWLLLRYYGDRETVRRAFPALERYIAFCVRSSDRLLRFATARDWLDLSHDGRSDFDHGYGQCDAALVGTAWFARCAQMMEEIARGIGEDAAAEHYRALYEKIRGAFRRFFLGRNRLLRGATQGGYLLAAAFGLIEGAELDAARAWVLADMKKNGGITWGTATTPVALDGLCALGLEGEAAAFVRREAFPSLGYMRKNGATAVWERWDAIYGGDFHPHQMNAFDHIGLATVGQWMIERLAGVAPASDGFSEVRFAPVFDREIGSMCAAVKSVHGRVSVNWRYAPEGLCVEAELPVGCKGVISLPFEKSAIRVVRGEKFATPRRCAGRATELELSSGRYEFIVEPNSSFKEEPQ